MDITKSIESAKKILEKDYHLISRDKARVWEGDITLAPNYIHLSLKESREVDSIIPVEKKGKLIFIEEE